jgi:hypothetical protein
MFKVLVCFYFARCAVRWKTRRLCVVSTINYHLAKLVLTMLFLQHTWYPETYEWYSLFQDIITGEDVDVKHPKLTLPELQ